MTELTGADDAQLTGAADDHRRRVVLPVTSAHDGLEHLVAQDTMTISNAGRYTGLCGRRVRAAVLACPPGPPCPGCIAVRYTNQPGRRQDRRTRRRRTWTKLVSWLHRVHPGAPR